MVYTGIVQGKDTFKGDGTLEDRLRSFAFWLDQLFRPSRILCKQCKSLHIIYAEEEVAGKVDLTLAQYCLTCHQELHEDPEHKLRSGSDVDCHASGVIPLQKSRRDFLRGYQERAPGGAPQSMTGNVSH